MRFHDVSNAIRAVWLVKYTTKLFDAYEIIKRYWNKTSPKSMVEMILKSILITDRMLITMAKNHVMGPLLGG